MPVAALCRRLRHEWPDDDAFGPLVVDLGQLDRAVIDEDDYARLLLAERLRAAGCGRTLLKRLSVADQPIARRSVPAEGGLLRFLLLRRESRQGQILPGDIDGVLLARNLPANAISLAQQILLRQSQRFREIIGRVEPFDLVSDLNRA